MKSFLFWDSDQGGAQGAAKATLSQCLFTVPAHSTSKVEGLTLNTVELEQESEPVESGKIRMLLESPTIRLEPPLSNLIR